MLSFTSAKYEPGLPLRVSHSRRRMVLPRHSLRAVGALLLRRRALLDHRHSSLYAARDLRAAAARARACPLASRSALAARYAAHLLSDRALPSYGPAPLLARAPAR